mgnify:CR=1 FL=1
MTELAAPSGLEGLLLPRSSESVGFETVRIISSDLWYGPPG